MNPEASPNGSIILRMGCADAHFMRTFYINQNFREFSLMPGPMVEDSTADLI